MDSCQRTGAETASSVACTGAPTCMRWSGAPRCRCEYRWQHPRPPSVIPNDSEIGKLAASYFQEARISELRILSQVQRPDVPHRCRSFVEAARRAGGNASSSTGPRPAPCRSKPDTRNIIPPTSMTSCDYWDGSQVRSTSSPSQSRSSASLTIPPSMSSTPVASRISWCRSSRSPRYGQ